MFCEYKRHNYKDLTVLLEGTTRCTFHISLFISPSVSAVLMLLTKHSIDGFWTKNVTFYWSDKVTVKAKAISICCRKKVISTVIFNPGSLPYLGQLQDDSVVHVELCWDRLDQIRPSNRNHPEAVPHHLQFLYGPHQVISEWQMFNCINHKI